jgi:hypothetical protein
MQISKDLPACVSGARASPREQVMSLFSELQRRKVLKVGGAYLVLA